MGSDSTWPRSSGGVVVELLAFGARGPGSIPGLAATTSDIGHLLLPSRDMTERSLKRRKSPKLPTNQRDPSEITISDTKMHLM